VNPQEQLTELQQAAIDAFLTLTSQEQDQFIEFAHALYADRKNGT
jgi:hypothetical protein